MLTKRRVAVGVAVIAAALLGGYAARDSQAQRDDPDRGRDVDARDRALDGRDRADRRDGDAGRADRPARPPFTYGREPFGRDPSERPMVEWPGPGQVCTVYLRGDATGAHFNDRLPDLGNLISRRGTLEAINAEWLLLKDGERRYHFPRASIVAVESAGEAKPKKAEEGGHGR